MAGLGEGQRQTETMEREMQPQPFHVAVNQIIPHGHNGDEPRLCDVAYFRSADDASAWLGSKPGYVLETTPSRIWRATVYMD